MNRRDFLASATLGTASVAAGAVDASARQGGDGLPDVIQALTPMTAGIVPIADDERRARAQTRCFGACERVSGRRQLVDFDLKTGVETVIQDL